MFATAAPAESCHAEEQGCWRWLLRAQEPQLANIPFAFAASSMALRPASIESRNREGLLRPLLIQRTDRTRHVCPFERGRGEQATSSAQTLETGTRGD